MNRIWTSGALAALALGSACIASQPGREASDAADDRTASGGETPRTVASTSPENEPDPPRSRAKGHVFVPRARSAHLAPPVQPVSLAGLPPLSVTLEDCFAPIRKRRPMPVAPIHRPRPGKGGSLRSATSAPGAAAPPTSASADRGAPKPEAAPSPRMRSAPEREAAAETRAPQPPRAPEGPVVDGSADEASAERAAPGGYHDWGAAIYLSNDDSMSLSSAQRVIYAIDHFLPIPREHVRPHELLNYFSFDTAPRDPQSDFSVLAELQPKPGEAGIYTLGLSVAGRSPSRAERRNASLTFVIDRSGSMREEGRMSYLQRGLSRMTEELKPGDLVNLVLFDDHVCSPVKNFVVGRDSARVLDEAIGRLEPRGATDVHAGLSRGYALANDSYQPTHSNRVVLITDALTNSGVTDHESIALIGENYDRRRIRLSGVGVGADFNDSLLDRLTERGRGAYVFLGSEAEVDAVFGSRFTSLIETVANDVHFRLHLPPSLAMNTFYGEESSTHKEDVLPIHYFAGTSQLFLSDLRAREGELRPEDGVMLSIEYENAETGRAQVEEYAFNLGTIGEHSDNVRKARLIMGFIDGVSDTLTSQPSQISHRAGGWVDDHAASQCQRGREWLRAEARELPDDPEVTRVVKLWETYCSRYRARERPREPVRRVQPRGRDVWPSAQSPH